MRPLYAPDPGSAESQKHNAKPPENLDVRLATATAPEDFSNGHGSGSPYNQHYEPAAEIWKTYLKETEADDKELAQLWQIGLDQLLIFAGLFGAILTAFLIESRKDLKEDPLVQILQTLRNGSATSISEPFQPTKSSLVVNAMWFSSLGLTLISALAAVLAKGWLAQYTPVTPGVRSNDACERHLRYLRSREWRLAVIVGGIPLLIQIALFLFAVGLVIFTAGDNLGISLTLLVMTAFATCLYALGTVLPWFSPACPFQTTMSDLIPGVAANRRYTDPVENQASAVPKPLPLLQRADLHWRKFTEFLRKAHHRPARNEMEADILAWMLTSSTNEKVIEEAVRAVAGARATPYLRDALHDSGASEIMCQRFTRYFKTTPDDALRTEAYLYALLRMVEPSGRAGVAPQLLLKLGQVLHRWDSFIGELQPLACALRTRLILAAGVDDHTEQWEQTKRNLVKMAEMGMQPVVRHVLVCAVLDGLRGEGMQLRKACAIIISKQFQIPAARKMVARFDQATKPGPTVAMTIMGVLKYSDSEVSAVILGGITTLAQFSEFRESIRASIPEIVDFLKNNNRHFDLGGVTALAKLSEQAEFRESIRVYIPEIMEFLKDNNKCVRVVGAKTLVKLSEQAEFRESIRPSTPQIVQFLDDNDMYVREAGAEALAKLSEQAEFRESIRPSIPQIVDLLKDNNMYVRRVGAEALAKLSEQAEFRESIRPSIPLIVDLLKNNDPDFHLAGAKALAKLSEQAEFRDSIRASIPQIVDFLKSSGSWAGAEALAKALAKLSKQAEFRESIGVSIPQIVEFLKDNNKYVCRVGVNTLAKLSEQAEFRESIRPSIPQIVEFLKDKNSSVRRVGANALAKFSEQAEFRESIRPSIPQIVEFLKDNDMFVRRVGANTLAKLLEQAEFREPIRASIPQIVDFLKSSVSWAGAEVLAKLLEQADFRESIWACIPQIVDFLKDNDEYVRMVGANTLAKFSEQAEFRESIQASIPKILDLLKDNKMHVRRVGAEALAKLSEQAEFRESIRAIIPTIVEFLKHNNREGANTLAKLSEQVEFRVSIGPALMTTITSVGHLNPSSAPFDWSRFIPNQLQPHDQSRAVGAPGSIADLLSEVYAGSTITRLQTYRAVGSLFTISKFARLCNSKLCDALFAHKNSPNYVGVVNQLAKFPLFRTAVVASIPQLVDLLKDKNKNVCTAAANTLAKLPEQAEFRESIRASISQIVEFLKDNDMYVRRASAEALAKLSEQAEFRESIRPSIPQIVEFLKDKNSSVRRSGVASLTSIAAEFRESIRPSIPQIVQFLDDNVMYVRGAGAEALAKLSEQAEFRESIRPSIPQIVEFLKFNDTDVLVAGVNALAKFSEQAEFRESIQPSIPLIVDLLKGGHHVYVDWAGAKAFAKLSGQAEFRESIEPSISQIMEFLKDNDMYVREAGANNLAILSEQAEIRESIRASIPQIVDLLKDNSMYVRRAGANVLAKLSKQAEFRESIWPSIPKIVDLLKDNSELVRMAGAKALAKLSEQAEFREYIQPSIPQIVELLKDPDISVRTAGVEALAKLSDQGDLCHSLCLPELRFYIPSLLTDPTLPIVSASAELFAHLVVQDHLRDMILEILTLTMKSLYSLDPLHQSRGVHIITVLAKYAIFAPTLHEIWAIYSFTQDFLTNTSVEQATTLVNEMALYGVLKTL
ncbi:armadillo-type protein [Mycena albidolilacea]|uniref:Armadillo-type protein n=1 Tax=Mycena albidolilacea TaxID=1033008 RepID=A0AAD7EEA1_9AGAR|nr:armadillo-type protein [Mycena albidolilacea]